MASEPTLTTLALAAEQEASTSQLPEDDPYGSTSLAGKTKEQIRKHYLRTLHKVIDQSDIVILVLDARDPEGCRSRLVEEEVRRREAEGKKLVFVLNKIGTCLYLSWSSVYLITADNRPNTSSKCTCLAQASSTHYPHSSLSLLFFLTASA